MLSQKHTHKHHFKSIKQILMKSDTVITNTMGQYIGYFVTHETKELLWDKGYHFKRQHPSN